MKISLSFWLKFILFLLGAKSLTSFSFAFATSVYQLFDCLKELLIFFPSPQACQQVSRLPVLVHGAVMLSAWDRDMALTLSSAIAKSLAQ